MKNYLIKDIESRQIKYPDHTQQEFQTLEKYIEIAKKIVSTSGKKVLNLNEKDIKDFLSSEDLISELAYQLMMGDWRYEKEKCKGKTKYSYRNQCGIWAIRDILSSLKTKANKVIPSINTDLGDGFTLSDILEDGKSEDGSKHIEDMDKNEKIKKYINRIIKISGLTDFEHRCIMSKYMDGKSVRAIAEGFSPPISHQAVQQAIQNGLKKMKLVCKGTDS